MEEETKMRISRDHMLMRFAAVSAQRGTCTRLSVGAIIARHGRVISQGYVGSPPGLPHCTEAGCLIVDGHCVRTTHAEENAIAIAAAYGISTAGAEMFITHSPCLSRCSKLIVMAGITRVVYAIAYKEADAVERLFNQAGIETLWYRDFSRDVNATGSEAPKEDTEPKLSGL